MKKNNKGFTLAELLIVVAIIAVLVAIAIPIFTAQLEKSREATDLANIRSAYAELVAEYLTWTPGTDFKYENATIEVPVKQTQANWQCDGDTPTTVISEGHADSGIDVPATTSGTYHVTIVLDDDTGDVEPGTVTVTVGD